MSEEWTIEKVAEYVELLYSASDPKIIQDVQEKLHTLQKSDFGFELANVLMNQASRNCKFFGALTYTVVINGVENEDAEVKYQALIHENERHLHDLLVEGGLSQNLVIIKKLLSNLSLLFILNHSQFADPILSIVKALSPGIDKHEELSIMLTLCTIIVEDITKQDRSSLIHSIVQTNIFGNVNRLFSVLVKDQLTFEIHSIALDCLLAWVSYISMAENYSDVRYDQPDVLVEYLFSRFSINMIDFHNFDYMTMMGKAMATVTDVLEINPRMFNYNSKSILNNIIFLPGDWGSRFADLVVFAEDRHSYTEEIESFVNLITTLMLNDTLQLAKKVANEEMQVKFYFLLKLTNYPGTAVEDESISEQLLTFWEDFINVFVDDNDTMDNLFADDPLGRQIYIERRDQIVNEVCSIYWTKIHFPSHGLTELSKVEFWHYRSCVADMFLAAFSMLNITLYQTLASSLIADVESLDSNKDNIVSLESTMYLLYKITEDCTFYESQSNNLSPYVDAIFRTGIIEKISRLPLEENMLRYVYLTLNNFFACVTFFLQKESGKPYLEPIFNLLISTILRSSSALSLSVSKTVLKLCQDCRTNLVPFLPKLEELLVKMLNSTETDDLIRQRLFNSYTSIAQSLKDPEKVGSILARMLSEIHITSSSAMREFKVLNDEIEEYLVSLLSCVYQIGKACEVPEEVDEYYSEVEQEAVDTYWAADPLQIRSHILKIINDYSLNYQSLTQNSRVTEKCCMILKVGANEQLNGPFKFPVNIIFEYLIIKMQNVDTNSVPYIYGILETMIIVNHTSIDSNVMGDLIEKVFTTPLEFLKSDPYTISSSIELFATILEKKPSLIIYLPVFESVILNYALDGLMASETYISKSVLKFWVAFLGMKKGTRDDQSFARNLMTHKGLGVSFVSKLTVAFVNTSRSNLESFYPMYRNVISKYPVEAKTWIYESLKTLNHDKLDDKITNILVSKIMLTRGQRSAHDVLKKLWLQLNGLVEFNSRNF